MTSFKFIFVRPLATNKFSPTGGVTIPISIFTTKMIPKCIGSTPSCVAIGSKSGTMIMITLEGSIN